MSVLSGAAGLAGLRAHGLRGKLGPLLPRQAEAPVQLVADALRVLDGNRRGQACVPRGVREAAVSRPGGRVLRVAAQRLSPPALAHRPARRRADGVRRTMGGLAGAPESAVLRGSLAERRPGDVVETFTNLTTEANATMRVLHQRMPVILPNASSPAQRAADWRPGRLTGLWRAPLDQDPELDVAAAEHFEETTASLSRRIRDWLEHGTAERADMEDLLQQVESVRQLAQILSRRSETSRHQPGAFRQQLTDPLASAGTSER